MYRGALKISAADVTDKLKRRIEAGLKICTIMPDRPSLKTAEFLAEEAVRMPAVQAVRKRPGTARRGARR